MTVGKRYQILDWAKENGSYIIEDDYDSELRYFGKPVPALQGLDSEGNVIYLGSFSSTLFSAIKISYMILPSAMIDVFNKIKDDYSQTCSKAEQLTLALFMERGYYQTGIRKKRHLYSQKLNSVISSFAGSKHIKAKNSESGINIMLETDMNKDPDILCKQAKGLGLQAVPASSYVEGETGSDIVFYYNQIPLEDIPSLIEKLIAKWESN